MSRRVDFVGKGPIVFEGKELPEVAKVFDLVPSWQKLPEDTRDWLMDLHYCWGRTRQLGSRQILHHVELIKQQLEEHHAHAADGLRKGFPDATEEQLAELVADWHGTLAVIRNCAAKTKTCRWTIIAEDESLEENLKSALWLCRSGVGVATPVSRELSTGLEFRIRSLPREQQLEWLASVSDAFSKKKTWWQRLRSSIFHRPSSR
jgi:hypothetical protein